MTVDNSKTEPEYVEKYWVFLSTGDDETERIQREIDRVLSVAGRYSFYPEAEWNRYRYGAPEPHGLRGTQYAFDTFVITKGACGGGACRLLWRGAGKGSRGWCEISIASPECLLE